MRYLYFIFCAIFICVFSATSQDTLRIHRHTVVEMDDTLRIAPNTVVLFESNRQIAVIGTLIARGTAEQPIIFTSEFHPENAAGTSWQGIDFQFTDDNAIADSSIFEHCVFRHAHAYQGCGSSTGNGGAIRATNSSRVRFSHCRFENNFAQIYGGAIYLTQSNILFDHCRFERNQTDTTGSTSGGSMAIINSAPTLFDCQIIDSRSSSVGGAIIAMNCNGMQLVNCQFVGNSGSTGGAMFISNCQEMRFVGNLFHHNEGRYFGGAFAMKDCTFRIINCTIADNQGGQGGGIYCSSGVNGNVYNTILSGNETIFSLANGPQVYIAYEESTLNFYNSLIENGLEDFGGSGSGTNYHGFWEDNLETAVPFVDCGAGIAYCLPEDSPCVNGGTLKVIPELPDTDLLGNPRIGNGGVDMGAIESDYHLDIQENTSEKIFAIYPNPATDQTCINAPKSWQGKTLTLYDMQGKALRSIVLSEQHNVLSLKGLQSGIYILSGDGIARKLLVE